MTNKITKTIFGNEYKVNKEYIKATELSEEILREIGEIRDKIDTLQKLTDISWCENHVLTNHRTEMIQYMKRKAKELEMSVDAYFSQTGE